MNLRGDPVVEKILGGVAEGTEDPGYLTEILSPYMHLLEHAGSGR